MVEIPQNAIPELFITSVSWEYISLNELDLPIRIIPKQSSVVKTSHESEFIINEEYYSSNDFMQTDIARVVETGEIRGHLFALVEVSPVQYKPSSGELKIMTSCNIRIDLPGSDITQTNEKYERYYSQNYEELFKTLFINHNNYSNTMFNPSKQPEGYLIIVYDNFYEEILPLVIWKNSIGYDVTVTKTSEIPGGTSKENIHDYIYYAYNNWTNPPAYVLLVGDTGQIPTYIGPESSTATDLYYVTMDTLDYFPDIFIGRFPASLESHVTAMVNKTIFYEQGDFESNNWIKNATFMAGNDNYYISEGTHNYVIDTYLNPNNYTCDKLYEVTYGATTQNVIDSISEGRSLAIFSGHGSPTSWADGPTFSQSNVNSLTNQDMYPFVCSHACVTGQFNLGECFGETWLRAENKGGLAFWGSSHNTYWDPDDILEKKMFYAWWIDDIETIGGMTDMALYYHYQDYSGAWPSKLYFECYNVLGDPSVKIWKDDPNPSYPPIITNISVNPFIQTSGNYVNISADVTDDIGVDQVNVIITYPNNSSVNETMINNDLNSYYLNNSYSINGTYSFYILAKDVNNTQKISESYTFLIGTFFKITDISLGWNFISLPFNQSVSKTDVILRYNDFNYTWLDATPSIVDPTVFKWNRSIQAYEYMIGEDIELEPGYGYWLFSYENCELWTQNISMTCYDDYITDLKQNWNGFGIPLYDPIKMDNLIVTHNNSEYQWSEAAPSIVDPVIFSWNRANQTYEYIVDTNEFLKPGYGYWTYAYQNCSLTTG